MLIAMIAMIGEAGTTDIPTLLNYDFPVQMQTWLWLAFFASLAVKMPMWPVHTWLPDAHVQAPTAGSMILAGVLLKLGAYGFIRFMMPLFPAASAQLMWRSEERRVGTECVSPCMSRWGTLPQNKKTNIYH